MQTYPNRLAACSGLQQPCPAKTKAELYDLGLPRTDVVEEVFVQLAARRH